MGETPVPEPTKEEEGYVRDEVSGFLYRVDPSDGEFEIHDPETGTPGQGPSLQEAIDDLKQGLIEYHAVVGENKSVVAPPPEVQADTSPNTEQLTPPHAT